MKAHTLFLKYNMVLPCLTACSALLFASCTHLYYSPNSANVPLFKQKGETRIHGGYASGSTVEEINAIDGGEIQLAYAVTNHTGVMVNAAFLGSHENNDNLNGSKDAGHGSLIEVGAGYFKPFKEKFVFEVYSGMGLGNVKNEYFNLATSATQFTKFFIQPSIGVSKTHFETGFASKVSLIKMKIDYQTTHSLTDDPYEPLKIAEMQEKPYSVLWEPTIFLRFGANALKAQIQYTLSVNLTNKTLVQIPGLFNAGISIAIPSKKKNE